MLAPFFFGSHGAEGDEMISSSRVGAFAIFLWLSGLLLASSCSPDRQYGDPGGAGTGGDAGNGGSGGNNSSSGSGGGMTGCSAGEKSCASGCVDSAGCCDDTECEAGETCTQGVCSSCSTDCPAPSRGSGQGVCKGTECTIRCATGLTLCGDACVALDQDGDNCGACDAPCEAGLVCQDRKCSSDCTEGRTACGASCAELSTDVNNCGACGKVCPQGAGTAVCEDGTCGVKCEGQLELCEGKCVDFKTDLASCGACGDACSGSCVDGVCCPTGQTNCNGECVDTKGSAAHCGACGKACAKGQVCANGTCGADCGAQTLCGNSCVELTTNASNCGACAKACPAPPSNGSAACQGSQCKVACAANFAECSPGQCTNTKTDTANCGGCGKACGGVCANGLCCPTGQTNCNGKCVNLQTDAKNCLSCGHVCASGQLCSGGACTLDCGSDTLCGQSCANLSTDPNNCKTCGNKCPAPSANGAAICAGSSGCDIKCNSGALRCADACCGAPAASENANAACVNNKCATACKTNYHACSNTSSPCYANTDTKHCGASCLDCTQANATAACNGTQCANSCLGPTLSCTGSNGMPVCGSWEFESGNTEGWVKGTQVPAASAIVGNPTTSSAKAYLSNTSLMINFDNAGGESVSQKSDAPIKVALCPGGQGIKLTSKPTTVSFALYLEAASGVGPATNNGGYFQVYNGSTPLYGGGDWSNDATGQWKEHSLALTDDTVFPNSPTVTHVEINPRVFSAWKGKMYIDRISVTQ
jgi:hypothetical protein